MAILICRMCEAEESTKNSFDSDDNGWWCDECDAYNYYEQSKHLEHQFTIIYEDKSAKNTKSNMTSKILKKQLSPFRYPGGKSKVIPYLAQFLRESKCEVLASPFTGGGSFELSMLEAGVVKKLRLNDLDYGVYAVWWCILHMPDVLIERIQAFKPTHKAYFKAQSLIKNDYRHLDVVEAAWITLLVNRLSFSGIAKANPLGGKNGTKESLISRWNPNTLIKRINAIQRLAPNIEVSCENATDFIQDEFWSDTSTLFIDPPYVEKGKALYNQFYTKENHMELAFLLRSLHVGTPAADILVTYDYNEWLEGHYYAVDQSEILGRNYSI